MLLKDCREYISISNELLLTFHKIGSKLVRDFRWISRRWLDENIFNSFISFADNITNRLCQGTNLRGVPIRQMVKDPYAYRMIMKFLIALRTLELNMVCKRSFFMNGKSLYG